MKIQEKIINQNRVVHFNWVKVHISILGNEIVDKAANKAHSNNQTELTALTENKHVSIIK